MIKEKETASMDEARLGRLKKAIESSYQKLRPYREAVIRLNEEYAGPLYGIQSTRRREKHVNLLKQAVSAYMTLLASNRPRVLLSAKVPELQAFAKHYQEGTNNLLKEIRIEKTISQWVRDAFFWLGVVKVHMADSGEQVAEGDILMDPGIPFASNVALDDLFFDMNASKKSQVQFIGDCYRLPIEHLLNSGIYDGPELEDLTEHIEYGEERLDELSGGRQMAEDDLEPMQCVADVWVPRDGKVYTFLVKSRTNMQIYGNPIAEMEYRVSELGPYKFLHFDEVSENVTPCSTAADLHPLDRLVNNIYRKNAAKALRQKDIHTFEPSAADTAAKLQRASDGEWVGVTNPSDVGTTRSGGMDANLHGFMLNSMELFDRMAGNLQSMLGLGASSDTVGQEKIIQGATSRREGQLQNAVLDATVDLVSDLAYLLWEDGYTELPGRIEVDGLPGVSYDATWKPGDREGKFSDFEFDIDVYSMQYQGPSARVNAINQLMMTMYLQMLPVLQQQGGTLDMSALVNLHSEMLNLPRLKQIIRFDSSPAEVTPPQQQGPTKPPSSTRNYVRRNISGKNTGVPSSGDWVGKNQG